MTSQMLWEGVLDKGFYDKLAQVHAAINQPVKDSVNPHFNSKFASLNECNRVVSDAVRSVGGCDYWQRAVYNSDANCWEMQTVFQAEGSAAVLSSHPFRDDANPQKSASASTYARRYSLVSAFNLAAEDDDGNEAARSGAPIDEYSARLKRRMWEAIKAWSHANGLDPNEEARKVQSRNGWRETSEMYEAVAIEYEEKLNG